MSDFKRTLVTHAIVGFSAATVFLGLTFSYNIYGVGEFATTRESAWPLLLTLWIVYGGVFTAVQWMVAHILNRDDDDDSHGGRRDRNRHKDMIPVRIELRSTKHRHRK